VGEVVDGDGVTVEDLALFFVVMVGLAYTVGRMVVG